MDREKLLDRIKRLLRLAESPNVHEATVAAARAQELMARHRIEAAALDAGADDDGIVDMRDAPLEASKRLRPWKTQLGSVVARTNGCRVYVLESAGMRQMVLVGRVEDAELVRALYTELVTRVECLTRHHGRGRDRAFCNAFRLGVVATLHERLTLSAELARTRALEGDVGDGDAPIECGAASVTHALARLDAREHAVDRYMEERLNLRRGRAKGLRADAEGYARGRIAGHTVTLDRPEKRR
jgi:hypothetical protein